MLLWPWAGLSRRKILAKARSDTIDQQIRVVQDSERCKKECNILLLGSHESGKDTLVKRMKIIHQGFDERERAGYRTTIYSNVLDSAGLLAHVVRRVGVGALEEGERAHAALLLAAFPAAPTPAVDMLVETNAMLTPALADAIWLVARMPAVESLLDKHLAEFYLKDSALYFLASIHRIAAPTYVPLEEDILHATASPNSTAIIETRLRRGDLSIRIIDVGGQRTEFNKWIHCFESVTSIMFCTALSEYGQVLLEEQSVNCLRESVSLFDSVINSCSFRRISVILFLNKVDVFERKLQEIPLNCYFPEYTGGKNLQKATRFILSRFMEANRARLSVYSYVTQATDMNNMRLVFKAVEDTILKNALNDSGIL
ncbi:heterotrimeric G protein alpha subunit 2 [Mycena epipterygia]|nr:heterotrimeric G protein alpha subunit 2 [Mycena epipterygia]